MMGTGEKADAASAAGGSRYLLVSQPGVRARNEIKLNGQSDSPDGLIAIHERALGVFQFDSSLSDFRHSSGCCY